VIFIEVIQLTKLLILLTTILLFVSNGLAFMTIVSLYNEFTGDMLLNLAMFISISYVVYAYRIKIINNYLKETLGL